MVRQRDTTNAAPVAGAPWHVADRKAKTAANSSTKNKGEIARRVPDAATEPAEPATKWV
jgi:hypothetical protein